MKEKRTWLGRRGQTTVEYIVITAGLFAGIISFYVLYSHLVPQQFDQGAKVILSDYNAN